MRIRKSLVPVVKSDLERRESVKDSQYLHGAERVEILHVEHLCFKARKGSHEFVVDESPERGGTDRGPNPLAYFVAGAASCLSTQFLRLIIAKSMHVDSYALVAMGRFDRKVGGSFREIAYEIRMTGSESELTLRRLAKRAELQCYAHNTLQKAGVKITTKLIWNGDVLSFP